MSLAAGALTTAYVRATSQAWRTVLDKSRLDRLDVPLAFDPSDHDDADYDAVPDVLARFEGLLGDEAQSEELRWIMVDGAVVFTVSQVLQAPFDLFVERVDVARGISLMADYVGGRWSRSPTTSSAGPRARPSATSTSRSPTTWPSGEVSRSMSSRSSSSSTRTTAIASRGGPS